MIWIYLTAAVLIAWGIARDITRRETWMIGFGKVALRNKPSIFWLTIAMRGFIFLVVLAAAWFRHQL